MDAGSAGCVVAALAVAGVAVWQSYATARSAVASNARVAEWMAKLAQSRPWEIIYQPREGDASHLMGESRGEFPVDKTITTHKHVSPQVSLEEPPNLGDPMARRSDYQTVGTERK
jgi:hypothetical protein